ncbi:phage portal protein [Brachyspira aalborgi]|jgi:HK97 family phage portal protein|uniref:Phage portal protein n=1 Tax=Brachyspira aalborgi TaxID=29522 RepID=A0ABY3KB17_9SPIR|nr:phage portal protein [Brachyspira aalborgi]MBS4762470.1 phage portal protein [Brachyspira sp.]TXJ33028.1 phage portal protein [Brachyspira aalborgi]TXJ44601.1 phage portal protein [Brachyspira aalborgi]
MAIIENIRRSIKKWLFPDNALGNYNDFSVIKDKSVAVVNPNVALTYSTIFACVRVIAETIATLPLFLYKVKGNNKVKAREHNLYSILHDAPNLECTSVSFFESLITQILLTGNGFAEIIKDNFNNILELHILDANKIRVYRDNYNNIVYEYNDDGKIISLSKRQVLHIAGLGWNGIIGYSPIALMRRQIATGIYQDNFALDFFSNGVKKVPILSHPNRISKEAKESMKESFRKSWDNGIVVLEEGITVNPITMNLSDAQFLESRRFSVEEICRIFRVPPHLIGDLSRSTNNNIEHQSIEFVTHTIRPWCVRIERALNNFLLNIKEKGKYTIEFMLDGLLRGDTLTRQQSNQIKLNNGILTRNQWRQQENMNEVEDEYGDDYFCSQQIRPIKKVYEENHTKDKNNEK